MTKKKSSQAETSKDAAKRPKNSNRKVNKSSKVSKSNASNVKNISIDDKYKKVLGLKEPIVVLKDCLKDGSLLNNLWLYNVSLEMKIKCDKPKNKSKKEGVDRKNSVKLNETSKTKESKSHKKNRSKNVSKSKGIKNIENTDTINTANNVLNTAKPDCTLKADQDKISPDMKENPKIRVTESKSNSSSAKAKHTKETIKDKVLNIDKCIKISLQKIPQPNTNSSAIKRTNKAKIARRRNLRINVIEEEDTNLSPYGKMMYTKYFLPTETSTPKENLKAHSAVVFAGKQENLHRETLYFSSEDLSKKQDKNGKNKAEPGSERKDTNSDRCTAFENTDKTLIENSLTFDKNANKELAIKGSSKSTATLVLRKIAEKSSPKTKSSFKQKRKSTTSESMDDDTVIKARILSVKPYPQDRRVVGKGIQNNLNPAKSNAVVANKEEVGVGGYRQLENGRNGVPKQSQNENKRGANNITKAGNSAKGNVIDDGDSDCISLFADSAIIEEYNDDKWYPMTDDVFENYYKKTSSEFNKMYTNTVNSNEDSGSKKVAILTRSKESASVPSGTSDRATIPKKRATEWKSKNPDDPLVIFRGFCYKALRTGTCTVLQCNYNHHFLTTMIQWCNDNEEYLFRVLDALAFRNHVTFLRNMYVLLLNHFCESNIGSVLRILKRLYELEIVNDVLVYCTVKMMRGCQHSIKSIVDQLIKIVNDSDFKFVNCMLKVIMNYVRNGEYWSTVKELTLRIEYFEPEIVEVILKECLNTRMHVQDVNACIMPKLYNETRSEINSNVLSLFEKLVKSETKEENGKGIVVEEIQSPSSNSAMNTSPMDLENEYFSILNARKTAWEINKKGDDNNNVRDGSSYRLHPIDDLPEPNSVYARSKFWKFYVQLHNLQQGLKHNDYDYVMQILNSVKKEQQSFFTRGCYEILCKEIKYSHYRLSKLVSHSVRTGTTKVSLEILADVAIYVLDHLAEESLWVLAHLLLKDMYSIFKVRIVSCKLNALTVMLFAEIFMANDEPLNAFSLLKHTKIFYSDPSKWKVPSTLKDNTIRILIITILFSALYKTHPEYAFSLFQFLVVDQGSNFYPIDLLNVANEIVPSLLSEKDPESIVTFAKLIIRYNFRLRCIAYRALITSLTQFDIALAKKLYRIATALGVYPMLQIQQATYLVVHSDWTRMEIYLIILHLMEQLSSNIGHAVDHISPKDCTIYFIFENTSTKRFVCNGMVNRQHDEQIESSVTLCKRVLQDKFDPPILTTKQLSERILMLDSVSVLNYLKRKLCA